IRDFHVTGVQTCALPIFSSGNRYVVSRINVATGRTLQRRVLPGGGYNAGGAIAVNRAANRVVVTRPDRDESHPSVWVLGGKLGRSEGRRGGRARGGGRVR